MAEDVEVQETALDDGSLGAATEQFKAFLNGGNDPPQEQSGQATEAPQAPVAAQPETPVQSAPVAETPAPVAQAPAAQAPAPVQGQQPQAPAPSAAQPPQEAKVDGLLSLGQMLADQMAQRLMAQFPELKTNADLLNLMRTNQGRYNEYVTARFEMDQEMGRIGQFIQQQQQTAESAKTAAEGERIKARAETSKKIGELIPDLLKPDVAPKLSADMTAYARANEVPPGRYVDATAGEVNILYKAMQYDAAKASEAAAIKAASEKASKAPLVQQPGTRVPGDGKTEKMQESFTTLQKTGRVDAAADVFRHILG